MGDSMINKQAYEYGRRAALSGLPQRPDLDDLFYSLLPDIDQEFVKYQLLVMNWNQGWESV